MTTIDAKPARPTTTTTPRRRAAWVLILLVLPAMLTILLVVPAPGSSAADARLARRHPPAGAGGERMREGTVLMDEEGTFMVTGERVTFYGREGRLVLRVLENLALERVVEMLEETGGTGRWRVSGTVTEYRGTNYLLLGRVLLETRRGI